MLGLTVGRAVIDCVAKLRRVVDCLDRLRGVVNCVKEGEGEWLTSMES